MKKLGSYTVLLPLFVTLVAQSPSVHANDSGRSWFGGGGNNSGNSNAPAAPELPREAIDRLTVDFTAKAIAGGNEVFIGNSVDIQQLEDAATLKQSTVLVSEPGVGKTARVEELALRLSVSHPDYRIYALDNGKFQGEGVTQAAIAENIRTLVAELELRAGKAILFIDEAHAIFKYSDVADILKPPMARKTITVFAATTTDEVKLFENDRALESRMQRKTLNNMTVEELLNIMRGNKDKIQRDFGIPITDEALVRIAQSTFRDFATSVPTRKAFEIVRSAVSILNSERSGRPRALLQLNDKIQALDLQIKSVQTDIAHETSVSVFQRKTEMIARLEKEKAALVAEQQRVIEANKMRTRLAELKAASNAALRGGDLAKATQLSEVDIPTLETEMKRLGYEALGNLNIIDKHAANLAIGELSGSSQDYIKESEAERFRKMPERIASEVKGQLPAATEIADTLRTKQIRVSRKTGPATVIVMGPPSTGKDFLASRTAKYGYGSETKINVIKGANYTQGSASVWQLMGSDVGFVGSDSREGTLVGPLRADPNRVTNIQNFEMMSLPAQEAVASIMGEDVIKDKQQRSVNVGNTTLMLTTQIGSDYAYDKARVRAGTMTLSELAVKYGADPGQFENSTWKERDAEVGRRLLAQSGKFSQDVIMKADAIVFTNVLTFRELLSAASNLMKEAQTDLRALQGIELKYNRSVVFAIARSAYDAQYGAANLNDSMKEFIRKPLTELIAQHNASTGNIVDMNFRRTGMTRTGTLEFSLDGRPTLQTTMEFHDAASIAQALESARAADTRAVETAIRDAAPIPGAAIDSNIETTREVIPTRERARTPAPRAQAPRSAAPRPVAAKALPRPQPVVKRKVSAPTVQPQRNRISVVQAERAQIRNETLAERRARRAMEADARLNRGTRTGEVDVRATVNRVARDKK